MGFQENFQWGRKFLTDLKQIAAQVLITEAPQEEDCERNTDLIILRMENKRVACRVRRFEYSNKYKNDFTIRSELPSGTKTELAKIIEGWGDYLIYGFADEREEHLFSYFLGDLSVFRGWHHAYMILHQGKMPGLEKRNEDGSSLFRVFSLLELPESFIVTRNIF